jgi:protein involved in polysaccharide export with SLBB domain
MSSTSQSPQLVVLLISLSLFNPHYGAAQNPQTPPPSNNPPDYLESLVPEEVEGRVINNGGNIEARFRIIDAAHPEVSARRIARDYMNTAYNSGRSIRSAKIEIIQPNGRLGLSITVGANIASIYKDTNWMDPRSDPSMFIQRVKHMSAQQRGFGMVRASSKNAITIKGPWSELTPQNSVNNTVNIQLSPRSARNIVGAPGAEVQGAETPPKPLTAASGVYRTEQSGKATPLQDTIKPEILIRNPNQRVPLGVSLLPAVGALSPSIAPASSPDEDKSLRRKTNTNATRPNPRLSTLEDMAPSKNKDTKSFPANAPHGDKKVTTGTRLEVKALEEKPAVNHFAHEILNLSRMAQLPRQPVLTSGLKTQPEHVSWWLAGEPGRIGVGLMRGIQNFLAVLRQKVEDGKMQPRAQETASAKSAAQLSAASREPVRRRSGSFEDYSSGLVLDKPGKLDQAVRISNKEGSKLTSIEPQGNPATEESSTISDSGPATRNEDSTTAERLTSDAPSSSSANPTPPKEVALTDIYRIGVGDVLDIRLLNSATSKSTLYTVIEGGFIDLPIAGGPIAVAGLTTEEIQGHVASELKRRAIQEDARVSVGVRQYASHSVFITGLVHNPGSKFLRREAVPLYVIMAEAQALRDAGRITIVRPGSEGPTVDLNNPAALNLIIRTGDTISVTARPQEFYYIGGGINYPGQKVFQPGISLLQAIFAAGGFRQQGDSRIDILREDKNGLLVTTTFKLKEIKTGKVQDPRLQAGDRIEVVR